MKETLNIVPIHAISILLIVCGSYALGILIKSHSAYSGVFMEHNTISFGVHSFLRSHSVFIVTWMLRIFLALLYSNTPYNGPLLWQYKLILISFLPGIWYVLHWVCWLCVRCMVDIRLVLVLLLVVVRMPLNIVTRLWQLIIICI